MTSFCCVFLLTLCVNACHIYGVPRDTGESFLCLPTEECTIVNDAPVSSHINISLMQSLQEKRAIEDATKEWDKVKNAPPPPQEDIPKPLTNVIKGDDDRVTGILYTSPDVWSVWIGGRTYNQDHCRVDDLLGEESTVRAKNSSVVEITQKGKTHIIFLGHSLTQTIHPVLQ